MAEQIPHGSTTGHQADIPGGGLRRITALFSDIRGFSRLTESLSPGEIVSLLNEYFEKMDELIVRNDGQIDKFMGDAILATFGAARDVPQHEKHGVRAGVEMQDALGDLNEKWSREGRKPIQVSIGVNSGDAIVAIIGAGNRKEFTTLGETLNLAARLESATREFGVDILIGEETSRSIAGTFKTIYRGDLGIGSQGKSVPVYSLERDSGGGAGS